MQSVNQRGGSRATGSRSERLSYCPVSLLLLGQAWAQSVLTDFHTLDKMCNAKTESNCTENPVEHLDLEDNVLDHLLFGLNKCLFSNGFWGLPLLFKTRPGLEHHYVSWEPTLVFSAPVVSASPSPCFLWGQASSHVCRGLSPAQPHPPPHWLFYI